MFYFLTFLICHGFMSQIVSTKECNPGNYICSGRCPNLPPEVRLPDEVAICMKDTNTGACVCWLRSEASHVSSLFLCEAKINGSITQILCQTPSQCFPPEPEPTCLVIPFCDCLLMNDDGSAALEFGNWKPVKAIVKTTAHSEKYPEDSREFSLKHLLFLFGFVIAPLLCWCLLNFVNEGKCKRKVTTAQDAVPISTERSNSRVAAQSDDETATLTDVCTTNSRPSSPDQPVSYLTGGRTETRSTTNTAVDSSPNALKSESPPSYDDATNSNPVPDEGGPPPTYEDAMQRMDTTVQQMWQTVYVVHSGPCENV